MAKISKIIEPQLIFLRIFCLLQHINLIRRPNPHFRPKKSKNQTSSFDEQKTNSKGTMSNRLTRRHLTLSKSANKSRETPIITHITKIKTVTMQKQQPKHRSKSQKDKHLLKLKRNSFAFAYQQHLILQRARWRKETHSLCVFYVRN